MLINIAYILIGLASLYFGGEFLITGCLRIAKHYKVSPFVIGATVMGFGTSSPELAVSLLAAYNGSPEMALGNVIGSNIANVGLVLGITALLTPVSISQNRLKLETPPLIIATVLITILIWNLKLNRWEGIGLILGLAIFVWRAFQDKEDSNLEFDDEVTLFANRGMAYQFTLVLFGFVLLVTGAQGMVEGSVNIARYFGISEWLIGISILAIGTSLPEIVSSTMTALKGHGEMALGNVFGSNIFNIFMVLGSTAAYKPLNITEPIHFDLLFTTGFTCLLILQIKRSHTLMKLDGIILLLVYFVYMGIKGSGIY